MVSSFLWPSSAYIDRMSDYCGSCAYRVTERSGPKACPFNALYWHYLTRHRARFGRHPRMAVIYKGWDARPAADQQAILTTAETLLARLAAGDPV